MDPKRFRWPGLARDAAGARAPLVLRDLSGACSCYEKLWRGTREKELPRLFRKLGMKATPPPSPPALNRRVCESIKTPYDGYRGVLKTRSNATGCLFCFWY